MSVAAVPPEAGAAGQLRIVNVLAWTAGCAVGMAACRATHPPYNERFRPVGDAIDVVMGAALGTFLWGSGLMILRRRRGPTGAEDTAPGRWLLPFGLVAAAAEGAAVMTFHGVARFIYRLPPNPGSYPTTCMMMFRLPHSPGRLDPIYQSVGWGLGALGALAFAAILRRRLVGPWVAVFLTGSAAAAYLAAWPALALFDEYRGKGVATLITWSTRVLGDYARPVVVCLAALIAAVLWDALRRRRTDGLHWAGVGAWLAIGAIQLVAYAHER